MKILSIETSCDDTGISILEVQKKSKNISFKVLANLTHSQIETHAPYGGVFPSLAKREHQKNLPLLLAAALKKAKLPLGDHLAKSINVITVTSGPGLEPALWTGIVFAKELAKKYKLPLIPVNHMEGHIFSVFPKNKKTFSIPQIKLPSLSLLVSGGHTELVLISAKRKPTSNWKYKIIGETLDDAAGEAFDKVARMLELPYPGGPQVSRLASNLRITPLLNKEGVGGGNSKNYHLALRQAQGTPPYKGGDKIQISLPRPMLHSKNFNFSFSGLKTAVLYLIRDLKKENPNILQDQKIKEAICLEFENAVVETLVYKTQKAIEKYNIQTLIVGGGVSANSYLKKTIQKTLKNKTKIYFPDKKLTGDNALMIGIAGYFKYQQNPKKKYKIKAEGNLKL